MRKVVCAIVINKFRNKILFVKKNDVWILPGGKPFKNESDKKCLRREFKEEVQAIPTIFKFYDVFIGKTPHKGDIISAKVYLTNIKGRIKPSAEISAAEWVDPWMVSYGYKVSEITEKIVNSFLKNEQGYNLNKICRTEILKNN